MKSTNYKDWDNKIFSFNHSGQPIEYSSPEWVAKMYAVYACDKEALEELKRRIDTTYITCWSVGIKKENTLYIWDGSVWVELEETLNYHKKETQKLQTIYDHFQKRG